MEIGVLSDIHGNYIAFERCVEELLKRDIKEFIFLGDYVGEVSHPQRTMELLYKMQREFTCHFVKGNKEDYWLNYKKNGETGWCHKDSTTGALLYVYNNLTQKDIDFFAQLPYSRTVSVENHPNLTICHGSPERVNEKILPDTERTYELLEKDENSYILCGHTHIQSEIEHGGKLIYNAGSVGLSLHGGGKAQCMVLHGSANAWKAEFINLDYDVKKVIEALRMSDLYDEAPCWCKVSEEMLRTGEISHGAVLTKAMELCREELGKCDWPDIPEKYWEQAVRIMLPS